MITIILSAAIGAAIGTAISWPRGRKSGLDANVQKEISRRRAEAERVLQDIGSSGPPSVRSADIRPTASLRSQAEVDEDSR